ncbi:MAG: hypothetical protein K8R99_13930 [Actinomycetia bacterium]|nr:hypothetical protein [Actinomycetes bacterium]
MTVLRWPLCVLILSGTLATGVPGGATPAAADGPTIEWVQTGDDSVMEATTLEAAQAAQAAESASLDSPSGLFQPVTLGDGFKVFSLRSYGDYTIKLVDTGHGVIENYRTEVQNMANEVNAYNGLSIRVELGTFPAPPDPIHPNVPTGEIWVMINDFSPCGPFPTGALGCGGVRSSTVVEGETRFSSGAVWLSPTLAPVCDQVVVNHEIGHALGLDHFDQTYLGQFQVMKSSTDCSFSSLRAGDLNGVRWLAEPTPSNDSVATAAVVCPGDSSVSASTWFATKEVGEATHAGSAARRSVWYRFNPRPEQNGGTATIGTSNDAVDDFDTVLEVYRGATPTTSVTSNDDFVGQLSQVTFAVDSAQTYWIVVDGKGGVGFGRGETDVTFDLPALTGSQVPLCAPARVLDTRVGGSTIDGAHQGVGAIAANATYQLPIAGRAGVPVDADSVVLNVTAVSPTAPGFVTVFPCGQGVPNASNLNFPTGGAIPNAVFARVGTAGAVCFFASTQTDLLVDVSGYFPGSDALVPLGVPGRLLDTRAGGSTVDGAHQGVGQVAANTTYALPVTNRAGVPAGAASVVLNVTAVSPSAGGFITAFPCGQPVPNASNLNFAAGTTIPNLVVARVGAGDQVCFFSSATTDLLVDVSGYFPTTLSLVPLTVPERLMDTRAGSQTVDGLYQGVGVIAANTTFELPIAGRASVPPGAVSVMLNVTALAPSTAGFVTVFPCGQPVPNASNLNFAAGAVIPNSVLARVGSAGRVCFFTSSDTGLLVDVSGYFP